MHLHGSGNHAVARHLTLENKPVSIHYPSETFRRAASRRDLAVSFEQGSQRFAFRHQVGQIEPPSRNATTRRPTAVVLIPSASHTPSESCRTPAPEQSFPRRFISSRKKAASRAAANGPHSCLLGTTTPPSLCPPKLSSARPRSDETFFTEHPTPSRATSPRTSCTTLCNIQYLNQYKNEYLGRYHLVYNASLRISRFLVVSTT